MRNAQVVKRAYLWALATALCLMNGAAQETASATAAQNPSNRESAVIIVERPHPAVIRIAGFDTTQLTEDVSSAQIRIADSLYDWIATRLANRFELKDRSLLPAVISEAELHMIFDSSSDASQRLRLNGADLFIVVRPVEISLSQRAVIVVKETRARVAFAARVVDARTSGVTFQGSFTAEEKNSSVNLPPTLNDLFSGGNEAYDLITKAGQRAVQQFVNELLLSRAKVLVALESGSYILSIGKRDGVEQGMHFELQRIEQIPLPDGGVHRRTQPLGVVKVVGVDDRTCEVITVGELNARLTKDMEVVCRICNPPKAQRKR